MRINTIQLLTNTSHTMSNVFVPIFAASLGASFFEIGLISALFGLTSFLSSFIFGKAADINRLRPIVLIGLAVSGIAFFLQVFAYDALSLALSRALVGFCMSIYPAALTVYIYYQKGSIGKFTSFGSLGWMIGYLLAAVIENVHFLFILSSVFYFVAFLNALKLRDIEKPSMNISYFSVDTFSRNIGVYLSIFVRHMGAVAVWTILPLYLVRLGATNFWIGVIYAINPLIQFVIMRRMDGLDNEWLVKWGCITSALAFTCYLLAPNFIFVIPGMVCVAFGWSFLYVGGNQLLVERNAEKATATGILNSVIAAASIVGSVAGGVMLEQFGYQETLIFAIVCSMLGMVFFKVRDSASLTVADKQQAGSSLKE